MANEVDLSELERYLRIFQENPDSRVFAPLADLYRRLGRLTEAEEICREGISRHPYYAGGRVALAHVLLDGGRLEDALTEIENVVTYYPDNLLARKILVRALGGLGRLDRARRELEALKALAPLIAADPDIERALQGPTPARRLATAPATAASPSSSAISQAPPQMPARPLGEPLRKEVFKPMEIQEKTEWMEAADRLLAQAARPVEETAELPRQPLLDTGRTQAVERSQRLSRLFRKKLVLESLLRSLEGA